MGHPFIDSTAVILGVVAGGLIVLLGLTVVAYVVISRRRERRDHEQRP